MGGKVKIASWAYNSSRLQGKTQEDMISYTLDLVSSLRNSHPDLICLPEIYLKAGGDEDNSNWLENTRKAAALLQECARNMRCYIFNSAYEPSVKYPGLRYNSAVLIDRNGNIAGTYYKNHPVYEESTLSNIIPGSELPVFRTDFGVIGAQICFDIGWRDGWTELARKGAKLIFWQSAYDGGNLLNTYAAHNMVFVVSSVRADHARIIDPTGRTIAMSSVWNGLAMAEINLDMELFHIDRQFEKINAVQAALGDLVEIHTYSEENVFTIESHSEQWPLARIKSAFGLVNYQDYHAEAAALQSEWKRLYAE